MQSAELIGNQDWSQSNQIYDLELMRHAAQCLTIILTAYQRQVPKVIDPVINLILNLMLTLKKSNLVKYVELC